MLLSYSSESYGSFPFPMIYLISSFLSEIAGLESSSESDYSSDELLFRIYWFWFLVKVFVLIVKQWAFL